MTHKAENRKIGDKIDLPAARVYRFASRKIIESRMFHFDITEFAKVSRHGLGEC